MKFDPAVVRFGTNLDRSRIGRYPSRRDNGPSEGVVTVAIAAMCDDGKKVVVAADRMLTAGYLSLEFEHTRSKITELSDSCVMMTAGAATRDIELHKVVKMMSAGRARVSVAEIVEQIKEGYQNARRKKIEELYLKPRGLTLERFLQDGRALLPETAMVCDEYLATFDYEIDVLVAGVDEEGAHIYVIGNPGTSECLDSIGYHTIGSGDSHAALSLIQRHHSHDAHLQQTMWDVYEAKKIAETAPGVGEAADFMVIEQGRAIPFGGVTCTSLAGLFSEATEARAKWFEDFKPKLETIPIPKKESSEPQKVSRKQTSDRGS